MITGIQSRPDGVNRVSSHIGTSKINQREASCRDRRYSNVLSVRARRLLPAVRRRMEIAMTAVLNRLTLQRAFRAAFAAGQLMLAVATAPILFASPGTQSHPTTATAPPAPVGVGWG
jgi:hypothetical protein